MFRRSLAAYGGIPDRLTIRHHAKAPILGTWIDKGQLLFRDDRPLWYEHPELGAKVDVVAIPLDDLGDVSIGGGLSVYGKDEVAIAIEPTSAISVNGYPFGLSSASLPIWATGHVASEPDTDFDGLPVFLIDCRSREGQSGAPVIAYRGGGPVLLQTGENAIFPGPVLRFLGVYSGRVNRESDLGFVWKPHAVQPIVEAASAGS